MSAGRVVDKDHPSARRAAELVLDTYPFPDSRQAVARVLVAFIKDDSCMVWPSALRLAHRAGVSEDTVQRALADFERTGLAVRVADFACPVDPDDDYTRRTGGTIARRVDMHRLHELYPRNVEWKEFRGRERSKKPKRKATVTAPRGNFEDTEVTAPGGNSRADSITRRDAKLPQAGSEVTASGEKSYRKTEPELPQAGTEVTAKGQASYRTMRHERLERSDERLEQHERQRALSGPHGRASLVDFAARSSTDVEAANGAKDGAQNPATWSTRWTHAEDIEIPFPKVPNTRLQR
ncbi:hypothetical protein [Paraburkholderia sp. BR10954]|uniref:hypothetical protein n=1 Tax=Paraburkholderia sp. BR10954 TaxID=3236995 RepID=UPI0034D1D45B